MQLHIISTTQTATRQAGKLRVSHRSQRLPKGYKAAVNLAAAEQQPWPFQGTSHGSRLLPVMERKWNQTRQSWTDGHFVDFFLFIFFFSAKNSRKKLTIHISPGTNYTKCNVKEFLSKTICVKLSKRKGVVWLFRARWQLLRIHQDDKKKKNLKVIIAGVSARRCVTL